MRESATKVAEAGLLVCRILDTEAMDEEQLSAATGVPRSFIAGLERVGRKQLHPELLFAETPGQRALRRLPYAMQQKYLTNPVPMVTFRGDKVDVLQVELTALTAEQAAAVFARNTVRSPAEQRAWLEGRITKTKLQAECADAPYRTVGKKLIVLKPCQFTVQDLLGVLTALER